MASSIPSKCKAAVAEKEKTPLVIKEIDVPQPKKDEILIKSLACGVCHSDSLALSGAFGDVFPRIFGHEVVGEVVATGPDEKRWKVGDRVGGGWHGGHDGTCKECRMGQFQFCNNEAVNGISRDGGYSEYCILRSEAVVSIPKDIEPAQAAPLLCAGVTVYNSVRKLSVTPGETVAVQGLGGLGHLALQFMRQMGYRTVALSSSASKKDFATKLGAHDYIDGSKEDHGEALQKIGGAKVIVVTAPNPDLIPKLVGGLAPRGTLLILAPVGPVPVDTVSMITKGLSVAGWPSGHALDSEDTIEFAFHHDVSCMVEKFKLEDVNDAIKKMEDGKMRFRGVIVY